MIVIHYKKHLKNAYIRIFIQIRASPNKLPVISTFKINAL